MANLHGTPVAHQALLDETGGYQSPDEYADQGDTRVIRDLLFGYTVEQEDAVGGRSIMATEASRGDEVTIEQIGMLALQKGEANHSFYTTREIEAIRNPAAMRDAASEVTWDNLSAQGEYELAEWLKTPDPESGKEPTINDILEAVGEDKELAHRMLQAENIATDGEPRKGLEEGLARIIRDN